MKRSKVKLVGAGVALLTISTGAAKDMPDKFYVLQGECVSLTFEDHDFTSSCQGKLANTVWLKQGRTGFYFFVERNGKTGTLTFSGNREVDQGADARLLSIDRLIIDGSGFPAVGTCHYENPFKGKATISCSADAGNGKWTGEFVTDGSPPK